MKVHFELRNYISSYLFDQDKVMFGKLADKLAGDS